MTVEALNYALLSVSAGLFVLGIWFLRRPRRVELVIASLAIPLFLLYSLFFLGADYFTGKGVDASVVYHIEYGLTGAGFGEYMPFIVACAAGVVVVAVATWLVMRRLAQSSHPHGRSRRLAFYLLLLAAFILNPVTQGLYGHFSAISAVPVDEAAEDFRQHYRKTELRRNGRPQKNLVVIYAESLERSYLDDAIFPGLAPRLKAIEAQSTTFLDINQVYGTYWTIAGIVASQCGIPLVTPSHGNSMSGMDRFLVNTVCLGDRLSQEGYEIAYLSGSSLEFAGTGKFFETHGYSRVTGPEQLAGHIPDDMNENGWGYYDDVLLDHAFREISELASGGKPYAYFISTMDTHHPGENVSHSCDGVIYGDGSNSILNAVECADQVIGGFIERIRAAQFGEDVVVVLASDHLAMRNSATQDLNRTERRNLLFVNEPEGQGQAVTSPGSMLDFTPSVAPFIGFDAEAGLGRNLLTEPSLRSELPGFNERLQSWDGVISEFWDFPVLQSSEDIRVDPENEKVHVAGRTYGYPILVEIAENLETSIRFDYYESGSGLRDFVESMETGTAFLWVQHCINMGSLELAHWGYEICLMAGRAGTALIHLDVVRELTEVEVAGIMRGSEPLFGKRSGDQIRQRAVEPERFIAHAGGAIDGHTYTNALEALDHNYASGFRLFELDIIETSDGKFVAAHDWEHWRKQTGYEGEGPPDRETFLAQKILGRYSPMDMAAINAWFTDHDDAVLVTDKINRPLDFSKAFVDSNRLMMELFSIDAVREAVKAGIRSAMPTGDLLAGMGEDKVKTLNYLGVKDIALSRRVIQANIGLLDDLRNAGIRVYVFHVGQAGKDERWVVCRDMDIVYGLYADHWDFETPPDCSGLP